MFRKRRAPARAKGAVQPTMKKLCRGLSSLSPSNEPIGDRVEQDQIDEEDEDGDGDGGVTDSGGQEEDEKENANESTANDANDANDDTDDQAVDADDIESEPEPEDVDYPLCKSVDEATPYVDKGPGWWMKIYDDSIPGFPLCVPFGTPRMVQIDCIDVDGEVRKGGCGPVVPVHMADAVVTYMYRSNFMATLNRLLDHDDREIGHLHCCVDMKNGGIKILRSRDGVWVSCWNDDFSLHSQIQYRTTSTGAWKLVGGNVDHTLRATTKNLNTLKKLETVIAKHLLSLARTTKG